MEREIHQFGVISSAFPQTADSATLSIEISSTDRRLAVAASSATTTNDYRPLSLTETSSLRASSCGRRFLSFLLLPRRRVGGHCVGRPRLCSRNCFIRVSKLGCDASILLDESPTIKSEKAALPNLGSVRGYDVNRGCKGELEKACPEDGIVQKTLDMEILAPLDLVTPNSFDNNYYKNVMQRKVCFNRIKFYLAVEQLTVLFQTMPRVLKHSKADFASAMIKMSEIQAAHRSKWDH
nr:lignin-forming anionic peroxidase-like [Ipomoea batatas]